MEIISNLQKIGKNKVVQRTSTCFSPIVKILPFWFYHLLFSFFFLFLYLPRSLLYSGSFPWPPLSFMALTWHVFEEYSLLPPPLFNRMFFILGFLVRLRLCVPGQNNHVGDTMSSGFGHTGSICSSLEMFILVIGSRWCSVCPMYSLWFFLPCI